MAQESTLRLDPISVVLLTVQDSYRSCGIVAANNIVLQSLLYISLLIQSLWNEKVGSGLEKNPLDSEVQTASGDKRAKRI